MNIVDKPMYLHAYLVQFNGLRALMVYASLVVRDTDSMHLPVTELIDSYCSTLAASDRFEDHSFVLGHGTLNIYELYPACPGSLVPHACRSSN